MFVSQLDQFGIGADAQFFLDDGDVVAHRLDADAQRRRCVADAVTLGHQAEDIELPGRQCGDGISGRWSFSSCGRGLNIQARIDERHSATAGQDGFHQYLGMAALAKIAEGTGLQRPADVDPLVVNAEHQNLRLPIAEDDAPDRLKSAKSRQIEVHDLDIRSMRLECLASSLSCFCLSEDVHVGHPGKKHAVTIPYHRMVVNQDYLARFFHGVLVIKPVQG